MTKELEIEFRNMLTKPEYERLMDEFKLRKSLFEQSNYYFDTPHFCLKKNLSALRIRAVAGKYELTLKTPAKKGLLETTQILTKNQAEFLCNNPNAKLPDGEVQKSIRQLGIDPEKLKCWGKLKTIRAETPYQEGLLVFDKNVYGKSMVDYNVEYEVSHYEKGKKQFDRFLKEHRIVKVPTLNKIERFYRYLNPSST